MRRELELNGWTVAPITAATRPIKRYTLPDGTTVTVDPEPVTDSKRTDRNAVTRDRMGRGELPADDTGARETDCECESCGTARRNRAERVSGVRLHTAASWDEISEAYETEEDADLTGASDGNAPRRTIDPRRGAAPFSMAGALKLRTLPGTHWHDAWLNARNGARHALMSKGQPIKANGRRWDLDDVDECAADIFARVWATELAADRITGAAAGRDTADARFLRSRRVMVGRFFGDASDWREARRAQVTREGKHGAITLADETDAPVDPMRREPVGSMAATLIAHGADPALVRHAVMHRAAREAAEIALAAGLPNTRAARALTYTAVREQEGASPAAIAAELKAERATVRQWSKRAIDGLPSASRFPAPVTVRSGETRQHEGSAWHATALHVADGGIAKKAIATRRDASFALATSGQWRGHGAPMPDAQPVSSRKDRTARHDARKDHRPRWARELAATHRDQDGNTRPMPGAKLATARRLAMAGEHRRKQRKQRNAQDRRTVRMAAGLSGTVR